MVRLLISIVMLAGCAKKWEPTPSTIVEVSPYDCRASIELISLSFKADTIYHTKHTCDRLTQYRFDKIHSGVVIVSADSVEFWVRDRGTQGKTVTYLPHSGIIHVIADD